MGGRSDADWGWCKNLRDIDHTEDQGVEGSIILKWILKREFGRAWTGLLWLWTGTGGGLL